MATAQETTSTAAPPLLGFIPRDWQKNMDLVIAIAAVGVIGMIIIPLPTVLLDVLIMIDIVISLLVLLMVLSIKNSTELSVFPSLLLVMTAYRLALNVSSTRLILTQGMQFDGKIITSFANFVVGSGGMEGLVVGIIIFVILIIVQFVVITKGATRVSEVAARFTLDAMPQKMMAVDSELQSGAITEEEAQERRNAIREESNFFGTMDGASKFVQGDVIAGIVITIINIIGGLVIGVALRAESFGGAAEAYLRFTVGDGLVTQIPAFFLSFATGLLVTRSAKETDLSEELSTQILTKPKNMFIAAGFSAVMGFLPGFPKIVLFPLAALLVGIGFLIRQQGEELATAQGKEREEDTSDRPPDVRQLTKVDPIELSIGANLIPLVDEVQGGDLLNRVTNTRRELALEMGMVVPPVRITDNSTIEPEAYVISINGTEMADGDVRGNMLLAINQGSEEELDGEPTKEPAFGLPAFWIDYDDRDIAEKKGYMVFSPTAVVATHLTEVIKQHANLLIGRQEVQSIIDVLRESHPALVQEVTQKAGSLGYIQKIMQNVIAEGISIKNTVTILETVADTIEQMGSDAATEVVRQRLGHQISAQHAGADKTIRVITIAQQLQEDIANSLADSGDGRGQIIAMDISHMQELAKKLRDASHTLQEKGVEPVVLASPLIRRALYNFIIKNVGKVAVISSAEIVPGYRIESLILVT